MTEQRSKFAVFHGSVFGPLYVVAVIGMVKTWNISIVYGLVATPRPAPELSTFIAAFKLTIRHLSTTETLKVSSI